MALKYNHAILDHESINLKSIVKLTRMVENHVIATFEIYDELFLKEDNLHKSNIGEPETFQS